MSATESKNKQPRAMSAQEIAGLNSEFEAMERSIQGYVDQRLAGIGQSNPNKVVAVASSRPSLAIPLILGLAMILIGFLVWRVVMLERTVARLEAWVPMPGGASAGTGDNASSAKTGTSAGPTLAPLGTFVDTHRPALATMIKDLVAGEGIAPGSVDEATAKKLDALAGMLSDGSPLAPKDLTTIRDGLFEYQAHLVWQKAEAQPPASTLVDGKVGSEEYPLTSLSPLWAELSLTAPDVLDETARQRVVRAAILAAR